MIIPTVPSHVDQALKAYDSRLRMHFDRRLKCFVVQEFVKTTGRWMYCFAWKNADGSFRPPPSSATPLLHKLRETDWSRLGSAQESLSAYNRESDSRRSQWNANRQKEWDRLLEHMRDFGERAVGVRQTFGAGAIRSRNWMGKGSEEYQKELRRLQGDT